MNLLHSMEYSVVTNQPRASRSHGAEREDGQYMPQQQQMPKEAESTKLDALEEMLFLDQKREPHILQKQVLWLKDLDRYLHVRLNVWEKSTNSQSKYKS